LFLKIVYHGPAALEELVRYDRQVVVGILGGSAGTTRDAFQLLHDAQKYGARVALFGRKINNAENQLAFVQFLRLIVDGVIGPVDAVRAYHSVLAKLGIPPQRPLDDDLKLTDTSMSYGGTPAVVARPSPAPVVPEPKAVVIPGRTPAMVGDRNGHSTPRNGRPDFAKMDVAQRLAYHRERLGLGR
jgi:hypothetical protein